MRLILIRHGEPDYEHDTLTEKGWREAACLAERVKKWTITDIYASPLGRAKDTAAPSLKALGREARILPWLQEYRARIAKPEAIGGSGKPLSNPWDFFPDYWTKQEEMYDFHRWVEAPVMQSGNGDAKAVYEETCRGLDALLASYGYVRDGRLYRLTQERLEKGIESGGPEDDTVVMFCHLGIICVMLSHLMNVAFPPLVHSFFLAPTSVTVLCTEERQPGIAYFRSQVIGDTSHLKDGGEPVSRAGYFTEPFQG